MIIKVQDKSFNFQHTVHVTISLFLKFCPTLMQTTKNNIRIKSYLSHKTHNNVKLFHQYMHTLLNAFLNSSGLSSGFSSCLALHTNHTIVKEYQMSSFLFMQELRPKFVGYKTLTNKTSQTLCATIHEVTCVRQQWHLKASRSWASCFP